MRLLYKNKRTFIFVYIIDQIIYKCQCFYLNLLLFSFEYNFSATLLGFERPNLVVFSQMIAFERGYFPLAPLLFHFALMCLVFQLIHELHFELFHINDLFAQLLQLLLGLECILEHLSILRLYLFILGQVRLQCAQLDLVLDFYLTDLIVVFVVLIEFSFFFVLFRV